LDALQIHQLHRYRRNADGVAGRQLFATPARLLDVPSVHFEVEPRPKVGKTHQIFAEVIIALRIESACVNQIIEKDSAATNTLGGQLAFHVLLLHYCGFQGTDQNDKKAAETALLIQFVDSLDQKVDVVVGEE
jgi:hypothetical protein